MSIDNRQPVTVAKSDDDTDLSALGVPNVLLVEDHLILQKIHRSYLEAIACSVRVAANGYEAIEYFSKECDLIFMDIGLPDMDGIEVSRRIRQKEEGGRCIIIALTTYDDTIAPKCRSAGMNDFISKPVAAEDLQALIAKWLPQYTR